MSTDQPAHRRHRIARVSAAVLAGVTLFATAGSAFGWAALNRIEGNLTVDSSLDQVLSSQGDTPAETNPATGFTATNILIVGTDTRSGQGAGYGNAATTSSGNGQSDTTILLHISADRKFAYGISIPRDSWVTRPSCNANGSTDGTLTTGKFNSAFAAGGRKCVVRAVKYLTGVRIDHFVEVDFKGFKAIVDALGGVQVCTTRPLRDPIRQVGSGWEGTGLDLRKGTQTISGDQALAFVRARHIIGDNGSDIERMQRQQAFVGSIIRGATSSGLLTDLPRLYNVLSAVTSSLTVDSGLSGDALKTFALSLQGLSPSDVTFATVPWVPRGDNSNVLWDTAKADKIWQAMNDDTPWPPKSTKPEGQKPLTTQPQDVTVRVLNGSGTPGLGTKAARQLQREGFVVSRVATAPGPTQTVTTMTYAPAQADAARTLAYAANIAVPAATPGTGSTITLVIGSDWSKATPVTVVTPGSGTSTGTRSASDASCVG